MASKRRITKKPSHKSKKNESVDGEKEAEKK